MTATFSKVMDSTQYQVAAELVNHPLAQSSSKWAQNQVEGPLIWIHSVRLGLLSPSQCFQSSQTTMIADFDHREIPQG